VSAFGLLPKTIYLGSAELIQQTLNKCKDTAFLKLGALNEENFLKLGAKVKQ
jgi:hypothetical protein